MESLKVATFNLRFASATPPNAWAQRRPVMRECIADMAPDVMGTQEGLFPQLQDIAEDQPAYDWIGTGRDGGSRGEFMAVFYRPTRLKPLEFDHFWLSDTPLVIGSTTWGNRNRRMVTWVRFLDLINKQEFYFFNTHLDHEIQPAREKSAHLIAQRANELKITLPILLVGDFNVGTDNKVYDILHFDGGFSDTWPKAAQKGQNFATFHGYQAPVPDGTHIDWILANGAVTTEMTEVVAFSRQGQFPSDHFPVVASVKLST